MVNIVHQRAIPTAMTCHCITQHCVPPQGNFNKLMMLQKTLNDMPPSSTGGIEWLWWLDIDTVIDPAQVGRSISPRA